MRAKKRDAEVRHGGDAFFPRISVRQVKAKAAGVSGKVEMQLTISENGQVIEAIAVSGPESLREAAEQAAKPWIFNPAKADRKPV